MSKYEKAVLISIKNEYVQLILRGLKTVEVRKTKPSLDKLPLKVIVYCSKGKNPKNELSGKVVAEFELHYSYYLYPGFLSETVVRKADLTIDEVQKYLKGKPGYGWIINELKIYDEPFPLSELNTFKIITRPPQSWRYIMIENKRRIENASDKM